MRCHRGPLVGQCGARRGWPVAGWRGDPISEGVRTLVEEGVDGVGEDEGVEGVGEPPGGLGVRPGRAGVLRTGGWVGRPCPDAHAPHLARPLEPEGDARLARGGPRLDDWRVEPFALPTAV